MKVGDIVGHKYITDFKRIILSLEEHLYDEYGENELKTWKVLWFTHPYGPRGNKSSCVEVYTEKGLIKHGTR